MLADRVIEFAVSTVSHPARLFEAATYDVSKVFDNVITMQTIATNPILWYTSPERFKVIVA